MTEKSFFIEKNKAGKRIDILICEQFREFSRNFVHKLFFKNEILVNNKNIKKNYKVKLGDIIKINLLEPEEFKLKKENIPLNIIYEDEEIIVVNKKRGMVVHPGAGNKYSTLVNALMWHCGDNLSSIGGILRPGIVHRIDKNTTGLLIVAKTDEAFKSISKQIKERSIKKKYIAIVHGHFKEKIGKINLPIGRNFKDRKKMSVNFSNGKEAITYYKVLKEYKNFSYIEVYIKTGRTHQIRVHMSYLNHPIAGDEIYGKISDQKNFSLCKGQCLHSKNIKLYHHKLKRYISFSADVDEYFLNFLNRCEKEI